MLCGAPAPALSLDTFDYSCEVDETLRDNTLPKLLLPPVVENSIFHGVGRLQNPPAGAGWRGYADHSGWRTMEWAFPKTRSTR